MKKETKQKWLEALRSGDYEQGKNYLCKKTPEGDRFCCLGVFMDIAYDGDWEFRKDDPSVFWIIDGEVSVIPFYLQKKFGMRNSDHNFLYKVNDSGWSFEKIADWIEKNIPEED